MPLAHSPRKPDLTSITAQIIRNNSESEFNDILRPNTRSQTAKVLLDSEINTTPTNSSTKQIGNSQPQLNTATTPTTTTTPTTITQTKPVAIMSNSTAEEINRKIITFIPEFNGHTQENIAKFIHCAEWLRKQLKPDEQKIFDELIIYRLSGDAYKKIGKKDISNFDTFKSTLNNIYSTTVSLEELYENCFSCTQQYTETVKQYGYRLTEFLEEYTDGYRSKYHNAPDRTYIAHLNEKAIQTFKNGLNNNILRDKMTTVRANTLDDIINETEIVEKMLKASKNSTVKNTPFENEISNLQYRIQPPIPQNVPIPIFCHFCKRPNHTWKECRTRLMQTMTGYGKQFPEPNYGNKFQKLQTPTYTKSCSHCRINGHDITECRAQNQNNNFRQQNNNPQSNNAYRIPQNKYCSYCRRNGHDIAECRTKQQNINHSQQVARPTTDIPSRNFQKQYEPPFKYKTRYDQSSNMYPPRDNQVTCHYCKRPGHLIADCRTRQREQNQPNYEQAPDNLESQFQKMKIFNINQFEGQENYPGYTNSGNEQGSEEH